MTLLSLLSASAVGMTGLSAQIPTQPALGLRSIPSVDAPKQDTRLGVLVFSKTGGFRHDSIETGQDLFRKFAKDMNWNLSVTEDAAAFTPDNLAKFKVVVFLNTTGDILDPIQEASFEKYVRAGGGFVGVHSAADTEYGWSFYGKLVGAYFLSHPKIQKVDTLVDDRKHQATKGLPAVWTRTDELYDYKAVPPAGVRILARLDTKTYVDWKMGEPHPIIWCQKIDKGRAFYTGFGHTKESYAEPLYVEMLRQAVLWAGNKKG